MFIIILVSDCFQQSFKFVYSDVLRVTSIVIVYFSTTFQCRLHINYFADCINCNVRGGEAKSYNNLCNVYYSLGEGDKVRVTVYQVADLSGDFLVLADGTLTLPLIAIDELNLMNQYLAELSEYGSITLIERKN